MPPSPWIQAGARLAALMLGLAAIDGALYTWHFVSGREITSALLPTLQKLAGMALVAWMVATSVEAHRAAARGA